MKTIKNWIQAAVLLVPFVTTNLHAGSESNATRKVVIETPEATARAKVLVTRLEELKAMDKSRLTTAEKKLLRMEVKSSKKELDELGGGVYLSVGAIILILVVLIILL